MDVTEAPRVMDDKQLLFNTVEIEPEVGPPPETTAKLNAIADEEEAERQRLRKKQRQSNSPKVGSDEDENNNDDDDDEEENELLGGRIVKRVTKEEIEELTKDIIGSYTEKQIEKLRVLQERFDEFHYEPVRSSGPNVIDDGTDPFFSFQSNLPQIMDILGAQMKKRSDDSDVDLGDDDDDAVNANKRAQMEAFKVDMVNNSAINEEKQRATQLWNLTNKLLDGEIENNSDLLNILFKAMPMFEEDTSEQVEAIGPLERQIQMYQSVLKFRRDQNNYLRRTCEFLVNKLESAFSQMSTMAPTSELEAAVANSAEMQEMKLENEQLRREQLYLYYRLYGPKHKYDPKAERQKKYRREVDETYKQMVDADVAKKVVKAVKNSDVFLKKSKHEIESMRKMMLKCHMRVMSLAEYGRMAFNANRSLEKLSMEEQDGHLFAFRISKALDQASAVNIPITNCPPLSGDFTGSPQSQAFVQDDGLHSQASFSHQQSMMLAEAKAIKNNCVSMNDMIQNTYKTLELQVRDQVEDATGLLADCLRTRHMSQDLIRAYSSSISSAADAFTVSGMQTAAAAMSVVSSLPAGVSATVAQSLTKALDEKLSTAAGNAIKAFTKSIIASTDHFGVLDRVEEMKSMDPTIGARSAGSANTANKYAQTVVPPHQLCEYDDDDSISMSETASNVSGASNRRPVRQREHHLGDGGSQYGGSRRGSHSYSDAGSAFGGSCNDPDIEGGGGSSGRKGTGKRGTKHGSKLQVPGKKTSVGGAKGSPSRTSSRRQHPSGGRHPHFEHSEDDDAASDVSDQPRSGRTQSVSSGLGSKTSTVKKTSRSQSTVGGKDGDAKKRQTGRRPTRSPRANLVAEDDDSLFGDSVSDRPLVTPTASNSSKVSFLTNDTMRSRSGNTNSVGTNTVARHTRNAFCQVTLLNPFAKSPHSGELPAETIPAASGDELSVPQDLLSRRHKRKKNIGLDGSGMSGSMSMSLAEDRLLSPKSPSPTNPAAGAMPPPDIASLVLLEQQQKELTPPPPEFTAPTEGELIFVFAGIDGANVFWERCAEDMPKLMEVYLVCLRDALEQHDGVEARSESDAFLAVFTNATNAVQWALSVQQHMMQLPYPKAILAQANGVKITGPDGNYLWRGFRLRMGMHVGTPNFHLNPEKRSVHYDGKCVTYACRLAMLANGGQILVSHLGAEKLTEGGLSELVAVSVRPQGECPGEEGKLDIFDVCDAVTSGRSFSSISAVDAPTSGGRLYQWLCTYSSSHEFAVFEKVCFCFMEVQTESDFPNYNAKSIASAAAGVLDEATKLAKKYNGQLVKTVGGCLMIAFKEPQDGAKFSLTIQGRAVQLPYPAEVLSIPDCREQYEGNFVCWKGLKIRIGLHYGRPEQTVVNRFSRSVEYFGGEVARAASVGGLARFGETVISEPMFQEVMQVFTTLEGAKLFHIGERVVDGENIELHSLYSASLYPRCEKLGTGGHFFKKMLGSDVAQKPKDDVELLDYELGDCTYVLSCSVDRASELLEECPHDCTRAMNLFLSLLRDALIAHDGFEAQQDGVSCYAFFDTPEQAIVTALNLQDKLMQVPFPADIERLCGEVIGDTSQDVIFRGLRVSMSLHRGKLHEFVAGAGMVKSYFGTAITQSTFLASGYSCGGELLLTQGVYDDLQETEDQTKFLAGLHVYRIENILLPGDHRRTGIYGLLPNHLQTRKRYFFRGKKSGVQNNMAHGEGGLATTGVSPGATPLSPTNLGSPADRRRMNKLTLDPQGGIISDQSHAAGASALATMGSFGGFLGISTKEASIGGSSSHNVHDMSMPIDFDIHPHRCNGQILQRVYRVAWKVANKTGRVMGYPVSVDPDPVMFDSALREAIVANYEGEELDAVLFDTENTILQRIEEMLMDAGLALNCSLEKGTCFHRAMQSAIIIPPSDASEEALYKKADIGTGKTINLSGDGKDAAKAQGGSALMEEIRNQADAAHDANANMLRSGFRPGVGADFAIDRMRERRMIELESELERTKNAAVDSSSGQLVFRVDQPCQTEDLSLLMDRHLDGKNGSLLDVSTQLLVASAPNSRTNTPQHSRRPTSVGASGALVTTNNGGKLPPATTSGGHGKRANTPSLGSKRRGQPPLGALQTSYVPDDEPSETLVMCGEPTSDATLLPPFSSGEPLVHQRASSAMAQLGGGTGGGGGLGTLSLKANPHGKKHVARESKPREREIRNRQSTLSGPARPGTLPFYQKRHEAFGSAGANGYKGKHQRLPPAHRVGQGRPPLQSGGSMGGHNGSNHSSDIDPFPPPPESMGSAPSVDYVD